MNAPSAVYFPLRANAESLVSGAGVASVRRQILVSLLLHDKIVLESGVFRSSMGTTGGHSFWMPAEPADDWQHPRHRGARQGRSFYVAVKSDASPADSPPHAIVSGTDELAWAATLEPFRREIPNDLASFVEFGHMNDAIEARQDVRRWDWTAGHDEILRRRWPNTFIRDAYVKGTHLDIGNAAILGVGLSVDRGHAPVVSARIRAGEAQPLLGARAMELQLPRGFGWADVADLKKERALKDFAAIMRDVEATALDRAVSMADLERVLRHEYWDRVARAESRRPARWTRYGVTGIGWIAGELGSLAFGGTPGLGGAIGAAAGHVAGNVVDQVNRPRWLSLHHRLRRHESSDIARR
jgi:hypothetical protein